MAAPSGIVWGSTVGTSPHQGRIGIYVKLTSTATQTTRHTEIWFWSKYAVDDNNNTFYYNDNATSATTSKGSVSVKTTVSSGSGWSTTNQVKIASYDYTFTRGTSADARSVAAKLTGIDIIGSGLTMTAKADYTIPALASYTIAYNANGGSGKPGNQTKYYGKSLTLSSSKPTRTGYTFRGWATSASGSVAYKAGATYTANAAVTLYAVWKANTYTVSYNANGGSGQPSNQTKTYGKALTLSSTTPKRTGYSFQGWATSASGSVVYAAGASYKANAAVTLYAVWKINTYTVTYNANGGALGSVKTQTKTYGATLKLTGTATRPDYIFKGWATSASGSVAYASGANYTANADVTLYAVWEVAYTKPRITNFSLSRCDENGNPTDSGTYARVRFKWAADSTADGGFCVIQWKVASSDNYPVSNLVRVDIEEGETSGEVDEVVGNGGIGTDATYTFRISVVDSTDLSQKISNLSGSAYHIDCKPPNAAGEVGGVSIGKPAELDGVFDVGFTGKFRKDVEIGERTSNTAGKTGIHLDSDGFIHLQRSSAEGYHPYIGFYLGDSTAADGQIRVNSKTGQMEFVSADGYKFGNHLYLPNNIAIYAADANGNFKSVLHGQNEDNTLIIGYGNYSGANGNTDVYGNDVNIRSAAAGNTLYRPYRRKGDTITFTLRTAGYVTNSGKDVSFWVPLAEPIVGSPTATIESVSGFVFRQDTKYTHGSTANGFVFPDSYEATVTAYGGIYIKATFSNTTNVTNNDTIGIYWSGRIVLS